MNTFLPYPDFEESAKCLDNRRLSKQRVECLQILNCLKIGPYQYRPTIIHKWESCSKEVFDNNPKINTRKTPWYSHVAVQMWKGFEKSLAMYGLFICDEWRKRGFKDSCFNKIQKYIPNYVFMGERPIDYSGYSAKLHPSPKWLGMSEFHSSHRAALLFKNFEYYSIFGWKEIPKIEYYWPSKHLDNL